MERATSDAHEGLGASSTGGLPGPDLATVSYRGIPRCTLPEERLGPDALRLPRRDALSTGSDPGGLYAEGSSRTPQHPQRTVGRGSAVGLRDP